MAYEIERTLKKTVKSALSQLNALIAQMEEDTKDWNLPEIERELAELERKGREG